MENKDILRYGIMAFITVLPMCGALYFLGEQKMAIGILALTVPFTLLGFVMKLYDEFITEIDRTLRKIL